MIKYKKNKLKTKGMPKVYYFNLDQDAERREFMESQYKKYNIDYERVSQSCYVQDNFDDWSRKLEGYDSLKHCINPETGFMYAANFLNHIEFMKRWLNNTNEKNLLIMEDDYDLSLIDYWHFDWNFFMENLPADWQAIKLNCDSRIKINFFLHPNYSCVFGAMLFKRSFVKKIVDMYLNEKGQIISYKKRSFNDYEFTIIDYYNVDLTLGCLNTLYTAPIFTTESFFCIDNGGNASKSVFGPIQRACHQWWRNERDFFTLKDFFTYNKPYDEKMTIYLNNQIV